MKAKAESIYAKITSYANYSQMNGIEREWFIKCIEEGLVEVQNEFKNLALPHVVGQSEQLVCDCKQPTNKYYNDSGVKICWECRKEAN